jgi:sulfite exporter TauE/SafE
MDLLGLLGAAFLLGLTGGIHCLAMCTGLQHTVTGMGSSEPGHPPDPTVGPGSAATHPIRFIRPGSTQPADADPAPHAPSGGFANPLWAKLRTLLVFHGARICGYALLGASVAGVSATVRWSAEGSASLRTLWILLNAAVMSLGLALALRGAMPVWIDGWTHRIWHRLQSSGLLTRRRSVVVMGLAWALLPCGLLGGALALALLASDALRGAAVMASFGLGTAIDLLIAQVALRSLEARLKGAAEGWQRAGIRLAGLMLASMAALALWTIARGQPHPFCGVG